MAAEPRPAGAGCELRLEGCVGGWCCHLLLGRRKSRVRVCGCIRERETREINDCFGMSLLFGHTS